MLELHSVGKFGRVHTNKSLQRLAALAGECDRLRAHLGIMVAHIDGGHANHSHDIDGIWDDDISNGDKAGTPCEWCAQLDAARAALSGDADSPPVTLGPDNDASGDRSEGSIPPG